MTRWHLLPGIAAVAAMAACDATPTAGSGDALSTVEAVELAAAWDGVAAGVMDGYGGPSQAVLSTGPSAAAGTVTIQFTSTRACPGGGTAVLQGTRVATRDGEGGGEMKFDATRTDAACTFPARGGGTVTITTTPSVELSAQQAWADGQPGTRTTTQKGSFDWARPAAGASGSCTVDLTSTWTPATRVHTLQGTFCGRTIDVTRTRS